MHKQMLLIIVGVSVAAQVALVWWQRHHLPSYKAGLSCIGRNVFCVCVFNFDFHFNVVENAK